MKAIILFGLIISSLCFNLRSTKQSYDSYVMAVQWANGYCSAVNCGNKNANVEKNTMTIHGLWPSLKSGTMLKECTSGVSISDDGSTTFQNMKKYWPSFGQANTKFWAHEYNKHGYCMVEEYGWSGYKDYFNFVINLHLKTYKDLIKKAFPGYSGSPTVAYDKMKEAIRKVIPGAMINMKCTSGYISEFYFYLEKNFSPSPNSKFSNSCKQGKLVFK